MCLASRTAIFALLSNFLLFGVSTQPAEAQFRTGTKQWAVLDFVNKSPLGGPALGAAAADAVSTLILGTNRYDVLPRETVDRIYSQLELTPPITRQLDILRVGQGLGVETVIVGEITDARINTSANGKSADVAMVVRGIDVASGLAVMGAAVHGQSTERPGNTADDVLLNEAVNYAAQLAVDKLLAQQVEVATVLTTPTTKTVQLNKGTRQGIKKGMRMVVLRGREEVATIRISEVETDSSTAIVDVANKGVAPGDKARAIVLDPGSVELTGSGGARVRSPRTRSTSSSTLLSILVVGALAATIATGGDGSGGAANVQSEAGILPDGLTSGVRISWELSIFNGGRGRLEWQVWRSDYNPTAIRVVDGFQTVAWDSPGTFADLWRDPSAILLQPTACNEPDEPEPIDPPAPGVNLGTSYLYSVMLIYTLFPQDLPGGEPDGETLCVFKTNFRHADGQATPLERIQLTSPPNNTVNVGDLVQFSWNAVPGAQQYAVEISTDPAFLNAQNIVVVARVESISPGGISTEPIDISGVFPNAERLYWRVGGRNAGDVPGPIRDAEGERYVFSLPFQFDRAKGPPPPPLRSKTGSRTPVKGDKGQKGGR
jgi:hypothetical protein